MKTMCTSAMMMRNNTSCKIVGIGIVRIKMLNGVVRTLDNVRHVPHLKQNMVSLSILDSKG